MIFRRALRCSFCRRPDAEVAKLVAGPRAYICDRCVETAARIMSEAGAAPHPFSERLRFSQRLFRRFIGERVQPWHRTNSRAAIVC